MSPREGQVGRHGVAERSAVPLKPGNAGYCAASMRATGTASSAIHRRRCTRARQAAPSAICRAVHGLGTPTSNDVRSSTIRSRSPARRKLRRTYTPSSARCRLARSRSRQCKTLSTCCEPPECANRRAARRNLIASLITNWRYRRSVQKLRPRQKQTAFPLLSAIRDRAKRAWLGHGTSQLSKLFLAPDSVDQIRTIAARAADTPGPDAMLRQLL